MLNSYKNNNLLIVSNTLNTNSFFKGLIIENVIDLPQLTNKVKEKIDMELMSISSSHNKILQLIKDLSKNDNSFKKEFNSYSVNISVPYYIIHSYIPPYKKIGNINNLLEKIYNVSKFSIKLDNRLTFVLIKTYSINSYDKIKLQKFILDKVINDCLTCIQTTTNLNLLNIVNYEVLRRNTVLLIKLYRYKNKFNLT